MCKVSRTVCNRVMTFRGKIGKVIRSIERGRVNVVLFNHSAKVGRKAGIIHAGGGTNVPINSTFMKEMVGTLNRPVSKGNSMGRSSCHPVRRRTPNVVSERDMSAPVRANVLSVSSVFPVKHKRHRLVVNSHRANGASVTASAVVGRENGSMVYVCITVNRGTSAITGVMGALGGRSTVSCSVMMSSATDSPTSLRCVTPCTKATVTRCFVRGNGSILVMCSSLSGRTITCHTVSLLLRHSPKHRTCPNSMFCLRSELLRHSDRLDSGLNNNSVATLPVVRARTNSISTCVPAGIVSVASNRVFLRDGLFGTNVEPTMGMKLSMSQINNTTRAGTVGGTSNDVHVSLTRCHRVRIFARFTSSLSSTAGTRLRRKGTLVRLLGRPLDRPLSVRRRMLALYVTASNMFSGVPAERMGRCRGSVLSFVSLGRPRVKGRVRRAGTLSSRLERGVGSTTTRFTTRRWTNIAVTGTGRVRSQVGDVGSALGVAGTVCVVSSSGLGGSGGVLASARPCFFALRSRVDHVLQRLPSLSDVCFESASRVPRRRGQVTCVMIATSGKLTKSCGRGVLGVTRRRLTGRPGHRLCILNRIKERCFRRHKVRVGGRFRCAVRGPALGHTQGVSRRLLRNCHRKSFSRVCVVCASVIGTVRRRTRVLRLLPLGGTSFRGIRVPLSIEHRRLTLHPSTSTIVGHVIPSCIMKFICNTLMRSFSYRRGTHVVTVRTTAGDTGSVLRRLSVVCGHTERTTVARRVARMVTKTGSRGHGGGEW